MRPNPDGNVHHLAGRGHFKVKRPVDARLEALDVVIANVATVFPQMCRNAVGAGHNRDLGRLDRIRMPAAPRIAHGRDVIDVDAETELGETGHRIASPTPYPLTRSARATTGFARSCAMMAVRCLRS